METVYQLMMGLSLAACAGVRAWLPLFVMGIMARTGHLELSPGYAFLSHDGVLICFGIATLIEFFGDKVIALDHLFDVIGTFARPMAGVILTSAILTKIDPSTALMLGLIAGGSTSLTIHAGKAATRLKATAFSPFHGGALNACLSFGEDILSCFGIVLSMLAPAVMFVFTVAALCFAGLMIFLGIKAGRKLFGWIAARRRIAAPPPVGALPAVAQSAAV